MALRLVEVIAPEGFLDTINAAAENPCVIQRTTLPSADKDMAVVHLITRAQGRQRLIDELQRALGSAETWRVSLVPVELSMPEKPLPEEEETARQREQTSQTREQLVNSVSASAALTADFLLMTGLAAIVAAAGLIGDNTAVVIGAMVIAPLLSPNIALALGAALGGADLVLRGAQALAAGIALAVLFGYALAYVLGVTAPTHELVLRMSVGPESALLALASGAAAALSITRGTAMSLVGVMVAVALLPPAVAVGIAAELRDWGGSLGAVGLLIVNVAAVNLAAQAVFFYRGVRPKTWLEKRAANQSSILSALIWLALLAGALTAAFLLRG
jgi:uncharacterized hydrophobic protein (TIGR00341 family)